MENLLGTGTQKLSNQDKLMSKAERLKKKKVCALQTLFQHPLNMKRFDSSFERYFRSLS